MSVFKCKMCGGDLEVCEGSSVCKCEYCGSTQTIPALGSEKKTNLFNRANQLRINSDFDKAATIYASVTAEFPTEAEAYWGLCLCKYGIEYVDDPLTGDKIPTCHRTLATSIFDDEDYVLAIKYAKASARSLYATEAKQIDELQQEIARIVKSEAPYDVFICYKETDENGNRTEDSVIGHDIYDSLTSRGLKVFFARVSLEDKLGQEYEPYIYAALQSAKVMLVVCTSHESLDATWVKNEWSRFLEMMKIDRSKALIPCYKGISVTELPKTFQRLQCLDLSKLGWIQDLTRGVVKICNKDLPTRFMPVVSIREEQKNNPSSAANSTNEIGKKLQNNPTLVSDLDSNIQEKPQDDLTLTSEPDIKVKKESQNISKPVPNSDIKIKKESKELPTSASVRTSSPKKSKRIKSASTTGKVRGWEVPVRQEITAKPKMTIGQKLGAALHILFIVFISITPATYSLGNNNTTVSGSLLAGFIASFFVWKFDKKKSVGRIFLDILLCLIAIIVVASIYQSVNVNDGLIGTWIFIILTILF